MIKSKLENSEDVGVVAAIYSTNLWNSQIIVFSGSSHFKGFFNRNDEYQKWIPFSKEKDIVSEWGINIPKNMIVMGFREIIR